MSRLPAEGRRSPRVRALRGTSSRSRTRLAGAGDGASGASALGLWREPRAARCASWSLGAPRGSRESLPQSLGARSGGRTLRHAGELLQHAPSRSGQCRPRSSAPAPRARGPCPPAAAPSSPSPTPARRCRCSSRSA
jgi:hypothetical protein